MSPPHAPSWNPRDLPDQSGRTVVVTGGNSGLGLETARELAGRGAHVVLACRSREKADAAVEAIQAGTPGAKVDAMELDLASLASIQGFAEAFLASHSTLHVLCNNAGVMALPHRRTEDDFEMQLGTNHLGHFALTGRLLPRLLDTHGARVVTVSSTFHKMGRIRFDDLQSERSYGKWRAYAQSKLANLLFSYELQRRLEGQSADVISVAAHPGYARTNLQLAGPQMEGSALLERLSGWSNQIFAQSVEMGALPSLYAAAAPDVRGGEYYGPDGFAEMRGFPQRAQSHPASHDREVAQRLWQVSEALTGVHYEALSA